VAPVLRHVRRRCAGRDRCPAAPRGGRLRRPLGCRLRRCPWLGLPCRGWACRAPGWACRAVA